MSSVPKLIFAILGGLVPIMLIAKMVVLKFQPQNARNTWGNALLLAVILFCVQVIMAFFHFSGLAVMFGGAVLFTAPPVIVIMRLFRDDGLILKGGILVASQVGSATRGEQYAGSGS